MIHEYLYMLIPYMSLGVLAIALRFKLHRRSVATFMSLVMIAVTSISFYYGYIEVGICVTVVYIAVSMARAMCKPQTDRLFTNSHCSDRSCKRRKCL